jgi:hypothetical protein
MLSKKGFWKNPVLAYFWTEPRILFGEIEEKTKSIN